jgi:hypothetical protein
MLNIQINEKSLQAKKMVEYLKTLPFVKIEEEPEYNKEFVKKVKKATKRGEYIILNNDLDIRENLGLK